MNEPTSSTFQRFRRGFWRPPRAHGDIVHDREVSFLELFYDLIYVVLIAQASHSLAHHPSWQAFGNFVVVFSLIWIAWLNGAQYHELHAREDGRSRVALFGQMLLIAPLASFTADAAGADGEAFAVAYAALLGVFIWLWGSVRRVDSPEYRRATGRYLATIVAMAAAMIATAFAPESIRTQLWGGLVALWLVGTLAMQRASSSNPIRQSSVTRSMIERSGLFVIIVLGEVVVGVVNGLIAAPDKPIYTATALAGMLVGFGLWWMYFDFVGRRAPRQSSSAYTMWTLAHLPLTLGIAAIGACMVNLIEHAADGHVPASTAWVTTTAFATVMLSLALIYGSLESAREHQQLYRKLILGTLLAIPVAIAVGAWQPTPLLVLGSLALLLTGLWWRSVVVWLRSDASGAGWPPQVDEDAAAAPSS